MRLVTVLITPPTAPLPYNSVVGPRKISICCAMSGSMLTAWSTLTVDTSIESSPSSMVLTRAPASPRMIGRDEPAEKNDEFTPSCSASVSPSVALLMRSSVCPDITAMGCATSAAERSRSTPVT